MNDRRFIELLNLYVDQELSDDDARELEQEIAQRPERQKIYSQYCRMQRACVRLFEQQSAPAPQIAALTRAAAEAEVEEEAFPVRRVPEETVVVHAFPRRWAWGSGLMVAAAACVAVMVMRQPADPAAGAVGDSPALAVQAPPVAATAAPAAAAAEVPTSDYRPVLVVNALLRPEGDAVPPQTLEAANLEWLQELKLSPIRRLPVESFQYDIRGGLQDGVPTFVNDHAEYPVATEMTAFQFQR